MPQLKTPAHKLAIEVVPIETLVPHPRNVRDHPEENLIAIMQSLTKFGQQRPLVVDIHNQVIAGNGTLESAKRLKWKTIQIARTNLDGALAEAYAIADNKTTDLSDFNFEKLSQVLHNLEGEGIDLTLTGFQKYEIDPLMQAEWNPGSVDVGEETEGATKKTLVFEGDDKATIEKAIRIGSNRTKPGSADVACLIAFCQHYLETPNEQIVRPIKTIKTVQLIKPIRRIEA